MPSTGRGVSETVSSWRHAGHGICLPTKCSLAANRFPQRQETIIGIERNLVPPRLGTPPHRRQPVGVKDPFYPPRQQGQPPGNTGLSAPDRRLTYWTQIIAKRSKNSAL